LWKHLEANVIHYAKISHSYDIFRDGVRLYTINIGMFPLEKSKKIGVIIGITIIILALLLIGWFIWRFVPLM